MADISQIKVGSTTYNIKDAYSPRIIFEGGESRYWSLSDMTSKTSGSHTYLEVWMRNERTTSPSPIGLHFFLGRSCIATTGVNGGASNLTLFSSTQLDSIFGAGTELLRRQLKIFCYSESSESRHLHATQLGEDASIYHILFQSGTQFTQNQIIVHWIGILPYR